MKISPKTLKGNVLVPPSKSISHRALIAAGFAFGESVIGPLVFSNDIVATTEALEALGASVRPLGSDLFSVKGIGFSGEKKGPLIDQWTVACNESGSTLRFLLPFSYLAKESIWLGKGRLVSRPLTPYYDLFDGQNISHQTQSGQLPLKVVGGFGPGVFQMPGNISSQFVTGLLMALPLLHSDSVIELLSPLESEPYVDLTLEVLAKFGIRIEKSHARRYEVKGGQSYMGTKYDIEGDYSQAAFWLVANSLGANVSVLGINPRSKQGDRVIVDLLSDYDWVEGENRRIDVSNCPDLVPILAVKAALSPGVTRIEKAERVRLKESDRLLAIQTELNKLGAHIEMAEDGLIIRGVRVLNGGAVDAWGDHRIAMALAIASQKCDGPIELSGYKSVEKSYPDFWEVFKRLGGDIHE